MAAARMSMAMATTRFARLSPLTHTSFSRNGAVSCSGVPIVSMSCTFRNFSMVTRRMGVNLAIVARATGLGSEDVATELTSENVATEAGSQGVATEVGAEAVATEVTSEDVSPEVSTEQQQQGPKLYVGNLPWECDSTQLAEVCQDFGTVETVEVIYDQETGRSRGFAFVLMASNEDAQAVINALDGKDLGGRILKVNFPRPSKNNPRITRSERRRPGNANKMFVSNFPWACDDEALTRLFSGYGTVVDAKVVYDRETGRSRGYGFVTMDTAAEVNSAMENLNGADYEGRDLRVVLVEEKNPPPRLAAEVNSAIKNLNSADYEGRELRVVLVEEKKPPPRQ